MTVFFLALWFAIDQYHTTQGYQKFKGIPLVLIPLFFLGAVTYCKYIPGLASDFTHGNFMTNILTYVKLNVLPSSLMGFLLRPFHLLGGLGIILIVLTHQGRSHFYSPRYRTLAKSFIIPFIGFLACGFFVSSYAWEGQGQMNVLLIPFFIFIVIMLKTQLHSPNPKNAP